MGAQQRLLVAALALAVASCTAYVRHDSARASQGPCPQDGQSGVIGLAIGRPEAITRGPLVVEAVVPHGPAGDANIQPGDQIRAIDGESTHSMTVAEAARLIRGRPNTAVELRIDSPRGARLITLIRVAHASSGTPHHAGAGRCHEGHAACDHCRNGRPCEHGTRTRPPPPLDDAPGSNP